jgi:hypothetical protein
MFYKDVFNVLDFINGFCSSKPVHDLYLRNYKYME